MTKVSNRFAASVDGGMLAEVIEHGELVLPALVEVEVEFEADVDRREEVVEVKLRLPVITVDTELVMLLVDVPSLVVALQLP